ncbi:MAG TPA: Kazal-type serine protease inhibitor domain-containing protein [Kofleriaceae bacterium]|nr:Kazal-type serine protease inhibitor domain-containing protein [Kofleriaceae bacterium]
MLRVASCLLLALAACGPSKDLTKGVVDDSTPPDVPRESGGKADGVDHTVAINVQSPHPYSNRMNQVFAVPLADLPSCATDARLHFRVLRTEADYDHVAVEPVGADPQWFDGTHDDTWTEWFPLASDHVDVRLDTDSSITRHGFEIDTIEWDGAPAGCPQVRFPPCAADQIDLAPTPGTCECPAVPQCAPLADVVVRFETAIGRNHHARHTLGARAFDTHPGPTDALVTTEIGTVDLARVRSFVRRAAADGLLATGGYDRAVTPGAQRDELAFQVGGLDVHFVAEAGQHDPEVQALIADFEALFACDAGGGLACGTGFSCSDGACVEDAGCVCPAQFDPVCGVNGRTFSNACHAGCANIAVAHAGACGITGDSCGTLFGLPCQDGYRCRYDASVFEAPFPDAGGACVATNYCDAPGDCTHLAHPAVLGSWACEANACAWKAGAPWKPVTNGRFETAHPYANGTSVWKQVYLPAEAQALRLVTASFALERDYDYLEVWTYQAGAWVRVARYTGTQGPGGEEFAGRYHYLRFVSDSSIVDQGFRVDAEWR